MNWLNIDSEWNDSVWIHSVGSKIKFIEHCMTLTTLAFLRIPHNTSYIITLGRKGEIFWLTAIRKFKCLSVLPVQWTTMRTTLRWDFLDNPWERVAKKRVTHCACDRVIATGWHCQLVFDWNLDDVRVICFVIIEWKMKKKTRQYTSHYTDKSLPTTLQLSKMNFSPFTTSFANVNVNQFAKFTQNLTAPSHHQVSFVVVIVKLQMSQPQTTHKMFSGISQVAGTQRRCEKNWIIFEYELRNKWANHLQCRWILFLPFVCWVSRWQQQRSIEVRRKIMLIF